MKPHATHYKDTILINFPTEVTVGEVENALLKNTTSAKKLLLKVIFHRLNNRYVRPLNSILPTKKRSGFLTMAAACLLIEALQAFKERKEYTLRGTGSGTFRKFFSDNKAFGQLVPLSREFYSNVRCGILHQAETYGNWLVIREKGTPLFNRKSQAINADVFLIELARSLRDYCRQLARADWNDPLWDNARFKLGKICEHCDRAKSVQKTAWVYCI
jgi:hypothetical protein